MRTIIDYSYGVIPIRRQGEKWEVFLIHQFSRIGNNTYWVFPKGHPEEDESPKQAALRELKEETSMIPETLIEEPTFKLEYSFLFKGDRIQKTVIFFIGVMKDDGFQLDGDEAKEAGWYTLEEAAERLDYKATKDMYQAAKKYIEALKND